MNEYDCVPMKLFMDTEIWIFHIIFTEIFLFLKSLKTEPFKYFKKYIGLSSLARFVDLSLGQ